MFLDLIGGVASILVTWGVLFACIMGIGLLPARLLDLERLDGDTCFLSFWFGLGIITLFLQVWHFAFPVTGHVMLLIVLAGLGGLCSSRSRLRELGSRIHLRDIWPGLAVTLLVGLWLANESTDACCSVDTAVYHLPSINWIKAYPAVPGLGNLFGYLAFNSSSLLYSAVLDTGPWADKGHHIANGLLVFVFLASAVAAAFRLWSRAGRGANTAGERSPGGVDGDGRVRSAAPDVFKLVLIAPAVVLGMTRQVFSFNTDLAVSILAFAGAAEAYRLLVQGARPNRQGGYPLVATATILAAAICFKLSLGGFGGATILTIIGAWWIASRRARLESPRRAIAWALMATAALGLTWGARGVVLSGYPAYPSTFVSVPVSWKVPTEQADATRDWIRHAGRVSWGGLAEYDDFGLSLEGRWLIPWLKRSFLRPGDLLARWGTGWSIFLPTALGLGACLLLVFSRRRRVGPRDSDFGWWLMLPAVTGIGFWFVAAPEPRFGLPLLWVFAALTVAQLVGRSVRATPATARRTVLALSILLGTSPIWLRVGAFVVSGRGGPVAAMSEYLFVHPPEDGWFHPTQERPLRTYRTSSGLELWVPAGTDVRCLDAPLPCTPHPSPNIRLRDPTNLGSGFETVGDWRPERWPSPWRSFEESWRAHH